MSWKKTITTVPDGGSWRTTIEDIPSELESLGRGALQGASFGFSDEAVGLIESLLTDKTYEEARDESRQANVKAQEANPLSYGAGEVGAAIGTSFIPGLGVLNGSKAASFVGRAGLAATQGALTGAGLSNEENLSGVVKDTAIGAVTGAAMQGIGEKIVAPTLSKAANALAKTGDIVDYGLKKTGKVLANIPEEYTEKYLSNPTVVNEALSREDLAKKLLDSDFGALAEISQRTGQLDTLAWDKLNTDKTLNKADLLDGVLESVREKILNPHGNLSRTDGFGSSSKKLSAIENELDKISKAYGEFLSEADLKSIVQDLRAVAYSMEGSPKYTHDGEGLRALAGMFDDTLKTNKAYQEAMVPVSENTRLIKDIERNFINKQDPQSHDKFFQKISRWKNADEAATMKNVVRTVDDLTGKGLSEDIENTLIKEAFTKDTTNGSRKTLLGTIAGGAAGAAIGGPAGGVVGTVVGAAAGQAGDKYAGAVMKGILNGRIAAGEYLPKISGRLGKFAAPINEAAKRGNKALAATHFLLMQSNPEYRKLINEDEE